MLSAIMSVLKQFVASLILFRTGDTRSLMKPGQKPAQHLLCDHNKGCTESPPSFHSLLYQSRFIAQNVSRMTSETIAEVKDGPVHSCVVPMRPAHCFQCIMYLFQFAEATFWVAFLSYYFSSPKPRYDVFFKLLLCSTTLVGVCGTTTDG
ncbi:hypothetical protein IF1G_08284 [Cordyceps javanica]|uniref:Uncharacterized protein n=1 Tax=Cordyceps javanica TaxID=43265 RepID=A0A545UU36_9HYPO|nr:hypothetical protein IF1G_08284 [Cordyceps javanica]